MYIFIYVFLVLFKNINANCEENQVLNSTITYNTLTSYSSCDSHSFIHKINTYIF